MERILLFLALVAGNWHWTAAQESVIATFDTRTETGETVIIRDSAQTDQDVLDELNLDDYEVGEEVRITDEMWEQMQQERNPPAPKTTQPQSKAPAQKASNKQAESKKKRKAKKKRKRRKWKISKKRRKPKRKRKRRKRYGCYPF